MFRFIGSLISTAIIALAALWLWNNQTQVRHYLEKRMETGDFQTLEVRYSADQIMEANKKDLLKSPSYAYLEPSLQFYPYALLEVKFTRDPFTTAEGTVLWGLEDGEMVIDTGNWEKTHGFEDCINSKADKNDFKVINALARNGGSMDRAALLSALRLEDDQLDGLVEGCRRKKLVIQRGNIYRLHFQSPRIAASPETRITDPLVTKPYRDAVRVNQRYAISQIENISQNAFGEDFSIRSVSEVYLPVYSLVIQNPDGSLRTTFYNAVTGRKMATKS